MYLYYTLLLVALIWCFLGIGMLISALARSADIALGTLAAAGGYWVFRRGDLV